MPLRPALLHPIVPAVLFAMAAVAALDCGGKVDTSLLPACPTDGSCTSDCKATYTDCTGTFELACTCDANGHSQCPELGAPACQNDCDALLQGTTTCSSEGAVCRSPTQSACLDAQTLYCTCTHGSFVCDTPPPDCPPPPACPPPSAVQPDAPCSGFGMCPTDQGVKDCDGNVIGYVECSCTGGTFGDCISPPTPDCPIDAGSSDASTVDGGSAPDGN